jgi:hypothetical protein
MNFNNLEDYSNYYASQLILQYIGKPRARETIKALARSMFVNFSNIGKWRSLGEATGDALIAIAELFGISGFYEGIDYENKYFAAKAYRQGNEITPIQEGFQAYGDRKPGLFLKYSDKRMREVLVNLSDNDLRGLIRMRALYFTNDLGAKSIQNILDLYFPRAYISEAFSPPTIIYNIPEDYKLIFGMLYDKRYLLKPTGIEATVLTIGE